MICTETKKLSFAEFTRPMGFPFVSGAGAITSRTGIILKITDTNLKKIGYGEASPYPELSREGVKDVICALEGFVKDFDLEKCPPSLLMALDAANADLLEGWPQNVDVLKCNAILPLGELAETQENFSKLYSVGFRTFKFKVSPKCVNELLVFLDQLEHTIDLRLDSNSSFSWQEISGLLPRFEPYQIQYWEDPYIVSEIKEYRHWQANTSIPLAVDARLKEVFEDGTRIGEMSFDVAVLKPTVLGSWEGISKMVSQLQANQKRFVLTSVFETEVGIRGLQRLAFGLGQSPLAHGLSTTQYFESHFDKLAPEFSVLPSQTQGTTDWLDSLTWVEL